MSGCAARRLSFVTPFDGFGSVTCDFRDCKILQAARVWPDRARPSREPFRSDSDRAVWRIEGFLQHPNQFLFIDAPDLLSRLSARALRPFAAGGTTHDDRRRLDRFPARTRSGRRSGRAPPRCRSRDPDRYDGGHARTGEVELSTASTIRSHRRAARRAACSSARIYGASKTWRIVSSPGNKVVRT